MKCVVTGKIMNNACFPYNKGPAFGLKGTYLLKGTVRVISSDQLLAKMAMLVFYDTLKISI